MGRHDRSWARLLGLGLLASAAGCSNGGDGNGLSDKGPMDPDRLGSSKTGLLRAESCTDLLSKVQNDAIAKLDLSVAEFKKNYALGINQGGGTGGVGIGGTWDAGSVFSPPSGPRDDGAPAPQPVTGGAASGGGTGGQEAGDSDQPVGASQTNTQVKGVDEADFVKLVDNGKGMFLLHGSTLRKLKTYPAEALSLEPASLSIEGQPSELFVTDDGKAVVFSSVYGYGGGKLPFGGGVAPSDIACAPGFGYCGGGGGGGSLTKITIADVSGATPKALRELYYQGNYISSRRYGDVVRVVLQAQSTYGNLYSPDVSPYDSFGRPYPQERIDAQLDQWRERTAEDIRSTELSDWLPLVQEAKDGKLANIEPSCNSYFVPQPGVADFGLTHVLSLDVSRNDAPIGGVTVLGQASTVYSSLDRMVLAQPDYRWNGARDFGFIDEQRTSLHVFELADAETDYLTSGWVRGHLPHHNPQFGIDVASDHTLRIVTTGRVRKNPEAAPESPDFWQETMENRVYTLEEKGKELVQLGSSENLGHYEDGESVHSARFVGDRAYVVTFRQTDPLIALDVADAAHPTVLGQIEIPGFSQYMHPLDQNHLITFGVSGMRGQQMQLFDVTDPASAIPPPKVLDLGASGWSELANNHKAFTYYAKLGLIALPLSGSIVDANGFYRQTAGLQVIKVDAQQGFTALGVIDHSADYEAQGCYVCDQFGGCYQQCGFGVEMRRGAFVESTDTTYVYGISHAAVSVSDLASVAEPIETVILPQSSYSSGPWYGTDGGTSPDAGTPPVDGGFWVPPPSPTDVPDASWPAVDAGVAMAP